MSDEDEKEDYTDLKGEFMHPEDDDDDGVQDTDDGGAIVSLDDDAPADTSDHFENMAETLPPDVLSKISSDLLDAIQRDKEAREKRDKLYEDGLRKTALADDAPGGADFEGASRAAHPVMTEACVDFAAKAMKELWPANGPVKDYIPGSQDAKRVEKAKRKTRLMNRQVTVEMKEARAEFEQMLTQLPLGGSQYIKTYHSKRLRRNTAEFVPIDNILIPYAASSFSTAERKTHIQYLTDLEMKRRVKSGQYVDPMSDVGEMVELTSAEQQSNRIEGKEQDGHNIDGLRTVYEVACYLDIESEDDYWPYLVTIDKTSHKVLAVYRNWDEEDDDHEELTWIVEFCFVPWRGGYGIGFPHMIGGLTTAINGALRALLDSALANTVPTAAALSNNGTPGQNIRMKPGTVANVEAGMGQNDVRQRIMQMQFNAPSPVLFQLLGFLVDAAKGVVRTSYEDLADDAGGNMPVGTTMALIEQGQTVFSAIHARLHNSMKEWLGVLHRLNKFHLKETEELDEAGEVLAKRADFEGPIDVIPVSDPHIFSETQRVAQIQAISQRAQLFPMLYNLRKVEERILDTMKIPNKEELLAQQPEPQNLNAVNENFAAMIGRPLAAFPNQDHMAHLTTHIDFMKSPLFGGNPVVAQSAMPTLLAHLREHIGLWYIDAVQKAASDKADQPIMQLYDPKDDEVIAEFDRLMAAISPQVTAEAAQALQEVVAFMTQVQQQVQQLQSQQMPQDPGAQVQMANVQRQAQKDQGDLQLKGQELQLREQELAHQRMLAEQQAQQKAQQDAQQAQQQQADRAAKLMQSDADRQSAEKQKQADLQIKDKTNTDDNNTAIQIATMEIQDADAARAQSAQLAQLDQAASAAQAAQDRQHNAAQASLDRAHGDAQSAQDRQHNMDQASLKADVAREGFKTKAAKVGVSTGTGINPGT